MNRIQSFATSKCCPPYGLAVFFNFPSLGKLVAQQTSRREARDKGNEIEEKQIDVLQNLDSPRMWRFANKNSDKDAKITFYLREPVNFVGGTLTSLVNKEKITLEIPADAFVDFTSPLDAPNGFEFTAIILKPPPPPKRGPLAESQKWTNTDGQKIQAAVLKVESGRVQFLMPNGSVVFYEASKLSPESIDELKSLVEKKKTTP